MPKIPRRTRSKGITAVSQYLGGPAELLPSEVPTLRDVLRLVLFLQRFKNSDFPKKSVTELAREAANHVLLAWRKSSSSFTPPVVICKKAIASRIQRAFNFFSELNNSKKSTRNHINKHQRT